MICYRKVIIIQINITTLQLSYIYYNIAMLSMHQLILRSGGIMPSYLVTFSQMTKKKKKMLVKCLWSLMLSKISNTHYSYERE